MLNPQNLVLEGDARVGEVEPCCLFLSRRTTNANGINVSPKQRNRKRPRSIST